VGDYVLAAQSDLEVLIDSHFVFGLEAHDPLTAVFAVEPRNAILRLQLAIRDGLSIFDRNGRPGSRLR